MRNQKCSIFRNTIYRGGIFIVVTTLGISLLIGIGSNQSQVTIAQLQQQQQQQLQANQTFSPSVEEQQQLLEGISFQIDNVTFSHHMASVNGIQLHYVIGGQGDPLVLLHGFPQSWYEWRHIMPELAKNYTVIAPDLRGFGDSSKPITGYDGKTTAEDIYQLVSQLGFNQILLVAHDVGSQTAYSYAAAHPNNVSKLVIMDFPFPGFLPPEFGENGPWWFAFQQTPNLPEALVEGKEREYISWFFKGLAYNPSAITEEDIDVFANHFSSPGGMRAAFEHFRAFPIDAEQNKESAKDKITMPVLVLGGDIYPALGGDFPGNLALSSTQALAVNVTGVIVPLSGHWIPEEQPEFVIKQLANFFGNNTTNTSQ
ncbi:MAG TPA: alpha/beta hydrolase [Nitrososphaeraceae archaeon]|nr:alpha/beta hydrolase [Nitrososphaeraceae archaeon]